MRLNKIIQRNYTSFSLYYQIKLPLDLEISIPSDDPVRLVSAFVEEMEELLKSMVAECDLIKALGFDGEATRKMRAFLQGPKPELLHHQKFFEIGLPQSHWL